MEQNPIFDIKAEYPSLVTNYGLIAGLVYTLPYSVVGLFMGSLADRFNRKYMLAATLALGGLSSIITGWCSSFPLLIGMRIAHGSLNSATNPLSYSLVSDIVPPERRATANSIISSGIYIGFAISSLSIIAIKKIGWR